MDLVLADPPYELPAAQIESALSALADQLLLAGPRGGRCHDVDPVVESADDALRNTGTTSAPVSVSEAELREIDDEWLAAALRRFATTHDPQLRDEIAAKIEQETAATAR